MNDNITATDRADGLAARIDTQCRPCRRRPCQPQPHWPQWPDWPWRQPWQPTPVWC